MKWEPEAIHIVANHGRLCGTKIRPWPERCMEEKWSSKLPICEDCITEYKKRTGRDYKSAPVPKQTRRVEQVGGLFLSDYRAFGYKGTTQDEQKKNRG